MWPVMRTDATAMKNPTASAVRNYASFLLDVCNEAAKGDRAASVSITLCFHGFLHAGEQLLVKADFLEEAAAKARVRRPRQTLVERARANIFACALLRTAPVLADL